MGVNMDQNEEQAVMPWVKFKRCVNVVIAIHRMKALAIQWRGVVEGIDQ